MKIWRQIQQQHVNLSNQDMELSIHAVNQKHMRLSVFLLILILRLYRLHIYLLDASLDINILVKNYQKLEK